MILLITHNDLDGISCNIVLESLVNGYKEGIKTIFCDYDTINEEVIQAIKEHTKYDRIYITDISVSEDVAIELDKIGDKVKLIDHHKTALWLNKYKWATVKDSYIDENNVVKKVSGASLFLDTLLNNELQYSEVDGKISLASNLLDMRQMDALTKYVDMVRLYDTWEWKSKNDVKPLQLNNLFKIYGRLLFHNKMMYKLSNGDTEIINKNDLNLLKIEDFRIDNYIKAKIDKVKIIEKNGKKIGILQCDNYISETGNRLCEHYKDEIDFIAIISDTKISLRSIDKGDDNKTVDVSKIAKMYGGGGHKHAAGFTIDESKLIDFYNSII